MCLLRYGFLPYNPFTRPKNPGADLAHSGFDTEFTYHKHLNGNMFKQSELYKEGHSYVQYDKKTS